MQTEGLKEVVEELFTDNLKNDTNHMTLGCFHDIGCNIERCRTNDYDLDKGTGKCCKYYENKCKDTLNAVLKDME